MYFLNFNALPKHTQALIWGKLVPCSHKSSLSVSRAIHHFKTKKYISKGALSIGRFLNDGPYSGDELWALSLAQAAIGKVVPKAALGLGAEGINTNARKA